MEGTWLSLKGWRLPVLAKQLQGRQRKRREWSGQRKSENYVLRTRSVVHFKHRLTFRQKRQKVQSLGGAESICCTGLTGPAVLKSPVCNLFWACLLLWVSFTLRLQTVAGGPQQHLPWAAPGSTRTDRKASLELESSWWADGRREPRRPQIHKSMKQPFCAHRDLVRLCFLICIICLNYKMPETSK